VVHFATHNFFDALGVPLALGGGFRPEHDQPGATAVVVLSDRYWRVHYDADPRVVGREITIGGSPVVIVGVAPRVFRGLSLTEAPDLYMPLHTLKGLADPNMNYFMDGASRSSPSAWLTIVGRLKSGETPHRATAALNGLPFETRRGGTFVFTDINTASLPEAARAGMRQFGTLLATTVGLLLLIGSLTVGLLLLIRTEARRDEFAMCLALGATRRRLAAGVAVEGAILALGGVVLSVPITVWLFAGASAFQLPGGVALEHLNLSTGATTLAVSALAALASSLLIGVVAGVFGVSADIGDVLRARAGATPRLARRRMRMSLVTAQVAVTMVLLAGAGLFARSLTAALHLNPGFDPGQVLTGNIELRPYGYDRPRADDFYADLESRLRQNASIRSVSMTVTAGGMTPAGELIIDGEPRKFPSTVAYTHVDDRYFSTMGMRIIRGRDFTADDGPSAPPVIIVSESFGRMLANGGDPIGHAVTESSGRPGQPRAVVRIVGVVPDVVTNVAVLEPLAIYYSLAQRETYTGRRIVLRASGDPAVAARETMAAINAIDPLVTPAAPETMLRRIEQQMGPQTLGVTVLGALSIIAVLLTVLGTYVLAETMAAARRREMGIRAALGATRRQLGDLVLRETVHLVGLGLLAGLGLAWLGAGTIRAFLFQVEPLDVATLASVSGLILTLALGVSLRPAIRAGRVELARLLRED
jgi:predicted permease